MMMEIPIDRHQKKKKEKKRKEKERGGETIEKRKKTERKLVKTLHNTLLVSSIAHPHTLRTHLTQTEHTFHNAQLGSRRVQTGDGQPVVDNHAGADDGAAAVDAAGHERHLQQRGEFVLIADGGLGVDDAALVGEGHVGACEDVVGDGLSEDFHAEDVGNSIIYISTCFTSLFVYDTYIHIDIYIYHKR